MAIGVGRQGKMLGRKKTGKDMDVEREIEKSRSKGKLGLGTSPPVTFDELGNKGTRKGKKRKKNNASVKEEKNPEKMNEQWADSLIQ